jgi:hypothetical protein
MPPMSTSTTTETMMSTFRRAFAASSSAAISEGGFASGITVTTSSGRAPPALMAATFTCFGMTGMTPVFREGSCLLREVFFSAPGTAAVVFGGGCDV